MNPFFRGGIDEGQACGTGLFVEDRMQLVCNAPLIFNLVSEKFA